MTVRVGLAVAASALVFWALPARRADEGGAVLPRGRGALGGSKTRTPVGLLFSVAIVESMFRGPWSGERV